MLTAEQLSICHNTISSNAFFALVMDALANRSTLSVVRMADGEKKLLEHIRTPDYTDRVLEPFGGLDETWMKRYGVWGISECTLLERLEEAAENCTYFAPSISGLTMPAYNCYRLFPARDRYVDNFFPNLWNDDQKQKLYKAAGRVTVIHDNIKLADALQRRALKYLGARVQYIPLSSWEQADDVIAQASMLDSSLTLISSGPGGKHIGTRLCGVSLDIGQAKERWSLVSLEKSEAQRLAPSNSARFG